MTTSGLMLITLLLPVTQYITVYYALMISYLYQTDAVLQELMIIIISDISQSLVSHVEFRIQRLKSPF